ncbi:MAG: RNA polymerase factor sigma-54 [Pseudomonadota bacterium]
MAVGLRLDLRQSQQLVMTPQLQQAIKLLQMSNVQLAQFVDGEIERNPLLRLDEPSSELPPNAQMDAGPLATDQRTTDHTLADETFDTGSENLNDGPPAGVRAADSTWQAGQSSGTVRTRPSAEELPSLEERLVDKPSLREHLRAQIGQMRGAESHRAIALYLVEELDEHGFLRIEPADVGERFSADAETVSSALSLLQRCEPTGVGARDLAECLSLQMQEINALTAPMAALLENLELVSRNELRRLRKACNVDERTLLDMLRQLKRMDPRPCAAFDLGEAETLVPDVLLTRTEWGGWHVELNPDTLPRVLIDQSYAAEVNENGVEAKHFLADCQSNASWLMKSLDQRSRTIVKIASEIIRQQEEFFASGIAGLRPLTLKAVADAVGMHESTVSRVTSNKHIATERGIFELKFFFTNAVAGGDRDVAAEAVRHRIKTMVDAEQACAVLSDDAIVEKLAADGIDIARRTVAKYRKSLRIPSSVERRRQKTIV